MTLTKGTSGINSYSFMTTAQKDDRSKKFKEWLIHEFRSWFATVLTVFLLYFSGDGAEFLFALYAGNYDVATFDMFLGLLTRTAIKTVLTLIFPKLFPKMLPAKEVK